MLGPAVLCSPHLVSWQQAQPTKPTTIREEQTSNTRPDKNKTNKHNKRPNKKGTTTPKHTGSEAGRESQRTNRNEGKTGGGSQQQQDKKGGPGEAAGTGGGSSTRRRAHAASGVLRGHLDHPKVNTSVQEGRAPEQHSQHGVEGEPKPLLP